MTKNNIFVSRASTLDAFGRDPTSQGLQEMFLLYPGALYPLAGATTEFTPLLQTSDLGGTVAYEDLVHQGDLGPSFNPDPPLARNRLPLVLAARITGPLAPEPASDPFADETATAARKGGRANVIMVADLDFIETQVVDLRLKPIEILDDLNFDNMSFFLNCVDSLAGDETFIPLRNRRAKQRTLEAVEEQSRRYFEKADEEGKAAAADSKAQLDAAEKRLEKVIEELREQGPRRADEGSHPPLQDGRREQATFGLPRRDQGSRAETHRGRPGHAPGWHPEHPERHPRLRDAPAAAADLPAGRPRLHGEGAEREPRARPPAGSPETADRNLMILPGLHPP